VLDDSGTVLTMTIAYLEMLNRQQRRAVEHGGSTLEAKQRQQVLDYDDLLLYWAEMMQEPSIAADVSGRFDHVLVDEYHDTNRLQSSILLSLKPKGRGLTVVGDDAQSINSFRAATVRNILDFPRLAGLTSTAKRSAAGKSSCSNPTCLAASAHS